MMRVIFTLSTVVLVSACMDTSDAPVSRSADGKVPNPIVMVGNAGAGAVAAKELTGDGLTVQTVFDGRAAGISRFCSGNADALALVPDKDLTSAERKRCSALGGGWSALTTNKGIGLYVRHKFASTLLKKAETTF